MRRVHGSAHGAHPALWRDVARVEGATGGAAGPWDHAADLGGGRHEESQQDEPDHDQDTPDEHREREVQREEVVPDVHTPMMRLGSAGRCPGAPE